MPGLAPGTEFAGHRIDSVAGRGGMGVVYRATQVALDRVVALKLIVPELADDPGLRDRFERESRIAASIDHPNVLPLYYAGEHDGQLYQAMRYVDGTDLRTLVRAHGALPPDRAIRIVTQVAAALDAAHARGLVHRDVKPANVMLTGGDHAYLGDFGLSRRTASQDVSTRGGSVVGTFDYVSPEQIRGERIDARSDVYALGGVLFTALTGQVAFPRESDEARLWAHLNAVPPKLSERAPGLPPALDPVIERALAKAPEDRYQSAGDLARAARAALVGSPVSEPERLVAAGEAAPLEGSTVSATIPVGLTRHRRRRPRRGVLIAGAALAAAGVGFGAAALWGSGDDPAALRAGGPSRTTPSPSAASPGPDRATPSQWGRVTGTAPTAVRPNTVALAGNDVWVGSFRAGLVRIQETRTDRRTMVLPGRGIAALDTGYGALWAADSEAGVLRRLRVGSGSPLGPPLPLAQKPRAMAVGAGGIWVVGYSTGGRLNSLVRADSRGQRVVLRVSVPAAYRVAIGGGSVWVLSDTTRKVHEIDARTGVVRQSLPTGDLPQDIAVGAGAVWITNSGDDSVTRIDLRSHRSSRIKVPDGPAGIRVRGTSVWVACREADRLARIDARTRRLVRPSLRLEGDPYALAVDARHVWVTLLGRARVARVAYRR